MNNASTWFRAAAIVGGLASVSIGAMACAEDSQQSSKTTSASGTTPASVIPVIDPGDGGDYRPAFDPAAFVDRIDNPYLPLTPGAKWIYEGTSDGEPERVEVVVTNERKDIQGISAVVVRDTVWKNGDMVEDTLDWFAQDKDGTVWYLGEDVKDYENGKVVSTAGSWEAGVNGALPGLAMPAQPTVGRAYRQEYAAAEAEDMAEVIAVDATESTPIGTYDRSVVIREWTPLDPEVVEEKTYALGIGNISGAHVAGGEGRVELVEYTAAG
jgi:hypothetical protein